LDLKARSRLISGHVHRESLLIASRLGPDPDAGLAGRRDDLLADETDDGSARHVDGE
jgi:hypothetical protein